MTTDTHQITVSGLKVHIVRKSIKNLHLGVYPPNGRVRVAAPLQLSDDAVRLAVVGKLGWIRKQRSKFEAQPRQSSREMVTGETHYFLGKRFRLRVVEGQRQTDVVMRPKAILELHLKGNMTRTEREQLLQVFYRHMLRQLVPPMLAKWQPLLGVQASEWRIRRMKTRWGTCNIEAKRIWLNLELAKKPVQCLEFILVHELAHLLERHHNDRFVAIMDKHLPRWRLHRDELNAAPLANDSWSY